jgi:uncharacterized protein
MSQLVTVGVISDTHGLLRPEALAALAGCKVIMHAGDVGNARLLDELSAIAPVVAVRGNNDREPWAEVLPQSEVLHLGEHFFYILHDIADLDIDPASAGIHAVISGHSHRPAITWDDGVLYLNPGSAGPKRFSLPVTVARLEITEFGMIPELVDLSV